MIVPPVADLLVAVAVVAAAALMGGLLARRLRQPAVIGEILAGVALGPTVLGRLVPSWGDWLSSPDLGPFLTFLAHIGLALFMLLVGLEIDGDLLRGSQRVFGAVAVGSLVGPFAIGVLAALVLADRDSVRPSQAPVAAFVLFVGTAATVTAFPVLARILRDRGLVATRTGSLALAAAAVTDVVAWILLAVSLSLAAGGQAINTGIAAVVIMGVALGIVRPALAAGTRRGLGRRITGRTAMIMVAVIALAAAALTSRLGLHDVFGPFLVGLVLPRSATFVVHLRNRIEDVTSGLLLPAFFVVAGLQLDLAGLVSDPPLVLITVGAVAVALLSKIIGVAVPAGLAGLPPRQSVELGVLLSCRGLTELVVLSVGLEAGLLTREFYSALVVAAVVTTVITGPALDLVRDPARPALLRGVRGVRGPLPASRAPD